MQLHQSKNNNRKGFTLALITSLMWGTLPIALKMVLPKLDPVTLTWYRFSLAAIVLNSFLFFRGNFPTRRINRQILGLWLVACLGLAGNHTLYVAGLSFMAPTSATVLIQLGPVLLLLGGLLVFREPFSIVQWSGFMILLAGMTVFFQREIRSFNLVGDGFFTGVIMIVLASVAWVLYALAQKQLLLYYSSQQIVAVIYLSGTMILLAGAHPMRIAELDSQRLGLVLFCGLNTIIAYGCFSEALQNWAASRVGAVLSIIPALTLGLMQVVQYLFPDYLQPEPFTPVKTLGASVVVAGSMLCALGKKTVPVSPAASAEIVQ